MNYRHAYHAGNFADVFKHILLTRMISYLQRKDKPLRVFDTHAGLGQYDLSSEEAQKTDEASLGVHKVLKAETPSAVKKLIGPWLDSLKAVDEAHYPGSPKVAHSLLRKTDRLSLYELHPEDFEVLKSNFEGDYQTRVNAMDGWLAAASHVPPKEGRGLMLVDPPFEDGKDWDRMVDLLRKTHKRWPGGVIALWYPIKKREHTDEWLETLRMSGFDDLISAELYIREPRSASMLNGCGMVILNPPYVLRDELSTLLPWMAEVLKVDRGSGYRVQNLS